MNLPHFFCFLVCSATTVVAQQKPFEVFSLDPKLSEKTQCLNSEFLVFSSELKDSKEKVPLIIYLHGSGGRGNDVLKLDGQPAGVHRAIQKFNHGPCLLVAPQCLKATAHEPAIWKAGDLDLLLEHLKATFPVDEKRIYLTGNSMGGYGSWMWGAQNPELFAAIAPMVGGLGEGGPKDVSPDLDKWAENLAKVPVWAFAGAKDNTVPAERSERMIRMIKEKGGQLAKLTVYPEEGHGAARVPYNSEEFYAWLFGNKRK